MHTRADTRPQDMIRPDIQPTEGLDPVDWERFADFAAQVARDATLRQERERKPWRSVPAKTRERIAEPLPRTGSGLEATYTSLERDLLPSPYGNVHPRFWGST